MWILDAKRCRYQNGININRCNVSDILVSLLTLSFFLSKIEIAFTTPNVMNRSAVWIVI